jgi:hypothetical protein
MTEPSADDPGSRSAILQLPSWLWGGNLQSFAAAAGWIIDQSVDGSKWQVRLVERVQKTPKRLRTTTLATKINADDPVAYRRLRRLAPNAHLVPATDLEVLAAEHQRMATLQDDVGAWLSSVELTILTAPHDDLEQVVQDVLVHRLHPTLSNAAVQLIELDTVVSFRVAALRALLYVSESPANAISRPSESESLTFESAEGLTGDLSVGLSAYLSPLFLSCAPWVWGISVARPGGVIVLTFGEAIIGRRGEAAEALQLFSPNSDHHTAPPRPALTSEQLRAAVRWWTDQLDLLLTETFDPANYMVDGEFQATRAYERHLGIEQLFRTVQSLSIHDRDPIARRALLFDALDTLEGVGRTSFDTRCQLKHAERTLQQLEIDLPSDVAPVLLSRARAGVAALRELQQGFFLKSRLTSDGLRLPDKKGERVVPLAEAAASWLRMLRNAGHGFSSGRGQEKRDGALLAAHNGRVPHNLPDLAYLYLLDLLAHPVGPRRSNAQPKLIRP